ncbi:DUF3152 domain-containing protein [Streptomyces sp. ISL-43]|nr:DUF3152 domain-containing protein [Streptomyces sp. ISL-43]
MAGARGGHPQQYEPGGGWGAGMRPSPATGSAAVPGAVYGDWRGAPRGGPAPAGAHTAWPARESDTPAFGTPAVGFPQVTLDSPVTATGAHRRITVPEDARTATGPQSRVSVPEDARTATGSHRRITVPGHGEAFAPADPVTSTGSHRRVRVPEDALTSTGSHRRIPGPRKPVAPAAPEPCSGSGSGRGVKVRTYTGMAAAAVTTVLAVVVAGQVASEDDRGTTAARASDDANSHSAQGNSAASRSEGRPTPQVSGAVQAAPELSYEQKMAQRLPIDEKLKGPGAFDTVPGLAPATGKGRKVRYRVDVEQGLGLDPQLFAEAVHRTLSDDRSWGHGGAMTFERVPGGEADFVITLASPGTTGVWCAKSGLDTTIDNVSCDSASTDRVMINAYRWAQGSATYGADEMFAYRQMLINHEVGHRLGHGHVNCRTPGALAPIMQQQTKSLDVNGIECKPNPWVFPGS